MSNTVYQNKLEEACHMAFYSLFYGRKQWWKQWNEQYQEFDLEMTMWKETRESEILECDFGREILISDEILISFSIMSDDNLFKETITLTRAEVAELDKLNYPEGFQLPKLNVNPPKITRMC